MSNDGSIGSAVLESYFDETVDVRTNDILAQLEKHKTIIEDNICGPYGESVCTNCKTFNNWIAPEEITYNLCWEFVGDSLCIDRPNNPPKPADVIRRMDLILRQLSDNRKIAVNKLTQELKDEQYFLNPVNRCYYCKSHLYKQLIQMAKDQGFKHVVNGINLDDFQDHRPGLKAAKEYTVKSPLVEAGFSVRVSKATSALSKRS